MAAGADHVIVGPSTFPAVEARSSKTRRRDCQTGNPGLAGRMIKRSEILYLGVAAGITGCLIGGMMLGVGMYFIMERIPIGWLLLLPAAPAGGLPGWMLAKRLAERLPDERG